MEAKDIMFYIIWGVVIGIGLAKFDIEMGWKWWAIMLPLVIGGNTIYQILTRIN